MSYFKRILAISTLLCGVSGFSQQINVVQNSFWLQEGYDRTLTIKDADYAYYNIDNANCKAFVEGNFAGRFSVVSATDSLLVLNPGGIVDYRFRRINKLPALCTETAVKDPSFEKNFKIFWLTFNDNYAFFKERNIKWQQVYKDYLPKVEKVETEQKFAAILREIVQEMNDGHIRLEIPKALNPKVTQTVTKPSKSKKEVIADLQQKYAENMKSYNDGVIQWGFLKSSKTGYIIINDMNNFADYVPASEQNSKDFIKKYETISTTKVPLKMFEDELNGVEKIMKIILDDLKNTESVVIDLRFNGGGYETVALKLLGHFVSDNKTILSVKAKTRLGFSASQHYNLVPAQNPYRKKVYVLTSHNTASAAEIFTLGTLSYPEIVRIGSPTAGIFSELLWKELPNGWEFSLSNEVYSDSKNKSYESVGIPANYEINYPKERTALYDSFYSSNGFTDKALEKVFLLEK
ncbi:S41 family peptidase [Flavobacterium sp. AC]|uniref:S41 family peptidase n=1 Tax=Flavobacterium azizsancarii TaxID=2961580 RepID=A0ABT4WDV6_9FLAO|nr:S41 family peptidase [Flavobacterium azizsancarii]MDA6070314.1 S41 family peptidase [Flavobacterium azizsancarii]